MQEILCGNDIFWSIRTNIFLFYKINSKHVIKILKMFSFRNPHFRDGKVSRNWNNLIQKDHSLKRWSTLILKVQLKSVDVHHEEIYFRARYMLEKFVAHASIEMSALDDAWQISNAYCTLVFVFDGAQLRIQCSD